MPETANIKSQSWLQLHGGVLIGLTIIGCWFGLLAFLLTYQVSFSDPLVYLFMLVQTHLYTGLFITAHDAMHGVVSRNRVLNRTIGTVAALLFAYNWFPRLLPRHHQHHHYVATDQDPDYYQGSFWPWYFSFLKNYITWWQLVLMAITFNVLKYFFPVENVILFWLLAFLLTYQVSFSDPLVYLFMLVQTHLYTGLFITAHDAMHGVVSRNRVLNRTIGTAAVY